jgi:hypothetical protein
MQPEQKTSWLQRVRRSVKARREPRSQREGLLSWIWRHCPENKRRILAVILLPLGAISYVIVMFAAVFAIIFAPLVLAGGHSGSLLEKTMRWYVHLFRKNTDDSTYVLAQACVAGVLLFFVWAFDWLVKQKPYLKSKPAESNASAEQ